jgi:hypothetical protein
MSDVDGNMSELLDDDVQADDDSLVPDSTDADDELGRSVGTLVEPGLGGEADDEADAIAAEVDQSHDPTLDDIATERDETQPAEEAAMHITEAPPMGDGDDYV